MAGHYGRATCPPKQREHVTDRPRSVCPPSLPPIPKSVPHPSPHAVLPLLTPVLSLHSQVSSGDDRDAL